MAGSGVEHESPSGLPRPKPVHEWLKPPEQRPLRQLPRLVWRTMRLVWEAGRAQLLTLLALQLALGTVMASQVLALRRLLNGVIAPEGLHADFAGLLPYVAFLAGMIALAGMVGSLQNHPRLLLTALVTRHTSARMLDLTCAVPLEAFETPTSMTGWRGPRSASIVPSNWSRDWSS